MNCRYCGSPNITYYKQINEGKIQQQFHYGIICLSCKKNYKVERSKEVYEKVKDQEWKLSKNAKRKKFGIKQAIGKANLPQVQVLES